MMSWSGKRKYHACLAVLLSMLMLLGGCTSSLNLKTESEIPTPVVTRLPLTMGVYFDDKFRNYVYEENSEDRKNWHIDNSAARVDLFKQVLPSMFKQVRLMPGATAAESSPVDAIIVPQVEEMQLALPGETYSDLYEAWIKYRIRLLRPDGSLIGEWPLTGYGKEEKGMFTSRGNGLNAAINKALRDLGAKLAIGFSKQEVVQQWLASKSNEYSADVTR